MISHSNLLQNNRMIQRAFGFPEHPSIITWLPPFHDMGLIGVLLQTLHETAECVLMPPEAAENHDLRAHAVTLLKPAACPRTSSGKIRRQACRTSRQKLDRATQPKAQDCSP